MSACTEGPTTFEDLERRLVDLKRHFNMELLKAKDLDDLSATDMDFTRAYIALCHAEFEGHLERWATNIIDSALRQWKDYRKPTLPLIAMFAHFEHIETNDTTATKIDQIIVDFKKRIRANNGIKSENLRKLFVPLGVDYESIDPTWVIELNQYSRHRGETVHTSAQIQQPIDVSSAMSTIDYVKEGIKEFESLLIPLLPPSES